MFTEICTPQYQYELCNDDELPDIYHGKCKDAC